MVDESLLYFREEEFKLCDVLLNLELLFLFNNRSYEHRLGMLNCPRAVDAGQNFYDGNSGYLEALLVNYLDIIATHL